jgi:hypothetical protein
MRANHDTPIRGGKTRAITGAAVPPAKFTQTPAESGTTATREVASPSDFTSGPKVRPSLFTDAELTSFEARSDRLRDAKDWPAIQAAQGVFAELRSNRARRHPSAMVDALLVIVGSRGGHGAHDFGRL